MLKELNIHLKLIDLGLFFGKLGIMHVFFQSADFAINLIFKQKNCQCQQFGPRTIFRHFDKSIIDLILTFRKKINHHSL